MEGKTKFAFIGNSHIAYWPLESYFPQWECRNYGVSGEGLDYVERFHEDVSDSYVVIQFGTNDIYHLNTENMDVYVERYVKAVSAILSRGTYLFCIFPRNDFMDFSPNTHFIASITFDLPEPFGPTIPIIALSKFSLVISANDLKPFASNFFKNIIHNSKTSINYLRFLTL